MKVLVVDSFPQIFIEALQALPIELTYVPQAQREEILHLLPDQEILIINSKIKIDREAADIATRLRLVLRAGVGMDHIDVPYLAQKGCRAYYMAGGNADAVGEQALGMLLALRHHVVRADKQVRSFVWLREANRGQEIGEKTVGIIGYGHTGKAVARRLSGFGCQVLAYDKYLSGYGDAYVRAADMAEIFAEADILTLHIPLTDETHRLVNDDFLARFQKPITFLNLSRGPITDLSALLRALDSGKVTGAALDVLENEKMDKLTPEQRADYENLFSRDNVIVTPHIGGWSVESLRNINNMILDYVRAELASAGH
ncbi:MAG: NAD(P)-dependent oxidoreductase [Bacteroidia bacterium]|nr:NAD(P)-dependent oxidoreductase [Bacteroidia bacterium]